MTSIPEQGFIYGQHHIFVRTTCDQPQGYDWIHFYASNRKLKKVTFAEDSEVSSIGDYAFTACMALQSINIPKSVKTIGYEVFGCCISLVSVSFQKPTQLKAIPDFAFYDCSALQSIELPEGIQTIGDKAFQYNFSLINISLPNSLRSIGTHFVCCASELVTLTIPAKVTTINGACFHGCEKLRTVYLLGDASYLQGITSGSATFGDNDVFCKEHVHDCTFYVLPEYLENYQKNSTWNDIDEHKESSGSHSVVNQNGRTEIVYHRYRNELATIPQEIRTFVPQIWVTAIFPKGLAGYKSNANGKLGENALVAVLDENSTPDISSNQYASRIYGLKYKLLVGDDIPAGKPVMVKPSMESNVVMYDQNDINNEAFYLDMTAEHGYSVTASDGAVITMKGKYIPYLLHPWDFYFMYKKKQQEDDGSWTYDKNEVAKFYRVPSQEEAATVGACRCYWSVDISGLKANVLMAPAKKANGRTFFDSEEESGTTGIKDLNNKIVIEGIYDMNGRKLDIKPGELPQGLYIMNGKKVLKK